MNDEIQIKEKLLRNFMESNGLDGILLSKRETFSWITAGKVDYIYLTSEFGVVDLLFTKNRKYCFASQYERYRIMEEELDGLGYEFVEYDWWLADRTELIRKTTGCQKIGSDWDCPGAINIFDQLKEMRYSLLPEEITRYRQVGLESALALEQTCRQIQRGLTEFEVCAGLLKNAMDYGIEAMVALVASDERIFKYRHPIATDKKIDRYALVVICGRKYGLVASVSRLVHFGEPPLELREKQKKVAWVDAELITNTIPGRKVADVFKAGMEAYKKVGYTNEWQLLHQGGPTGYAVRDYHGTPEVKGVVKVNQAFAWNPSITGTKSEDTFITKENDFEVITNTNNWPLLEVEAGNGAKVKRPDILIM
jgi:Xaa-Pro dipeptidase